MNEEEKLRAFQQNQTQENDNKKKELKQDKNRRGSKRSFSFSLICRWASYWKTPNHLYYYTKKKQRCSICILDLIFHCFSSFFLSICLQPQRAKNSIHLTFSFQKPTYTSWHFRLSNRIVVLVKRKIVRLAMSKPKSYILFLVKTTIRYTAHGIRWIILNKEAYFVRTYTHTHTHSYTTCNNKQPLTLT